MRAAVRAAALAVMLTACSEDAVAPTGSETGLPSKYQVPVIADPLDPGRFAAEPCALLTPEQRNRFGLPDTEQKQLADTVECLLHPRGDSVTTVQLQLMTDRGLADLVAQCRGENAPKACTTWAPATVEQYPAVLDNGARCRLMVGVADQAVLLVNDVDEQECRRATGIATAALTTLREEP